MTSIAAALEIINSDLDAERNHAMRTSTHGKKSKIESSSSKLNRFNIIEKSGTVQQVENRDLRNYALVNSKLELETEHLKNFEKIFGFFTTYAKAIGVETTYEWRPEKHSLFYFTVFLLTLTWMCIFYTQYIHINNGEILRFLEACAIYGIASSCTQKVFGYLKNRSQILSLFFCIRRICRQTLCGSQADTLKSNLLKTFTFLKMYTVGVASCLGLFLFCPLKSYVVDNELTSMLPLEILFVDQSTYSGFAVANVIMTVLGIYAALGTVLYGAIFIYQILMYALKVNLIGQDFKDLDEMWADGSTVTLGYKQSFLKNICNKQQDIKDFIRTTKDIFEKNFSYYFCLNYFSQIICLYEITKNQWMPGYAVATALFIEMMFYCVLGSQITIADNKLCSIIYNTNWYEYDLSSQKTVMLMLQRSQQLNELHLGPLGPLNMQTGIEIVKSIYTYYTVLSEVL